MSITQRGLQWTGLGKLVSFYRYLAFNLPRLTTACGMALLLGFAAIRIDQLFADAELPAYLTAAHALFATGAVLGAAGLAFRRPVGGLAWALGSVVSLSFIGLYLYSRTGGLPDLPELVGRWDNVLGTLSLGLAGGFAGLHFSVLTGLNVAVPQRRRWHD